MEFTLNEIDTDGIRKESFRGDEYLVAPATLMKAMNLDRGYVPEEHVKKSAPAWNGIPVTLFHPANEHGQKVSANSPHVAEKTWLGYIFNAEPKNDGERLDGEVWIDINNAKERGGEAEKIVNKFENNEPVSLSTAYFGDRLEPGMYDNEQRERVIGNLRPDHLAMLPGKEGKCSIEDGCMAGAPAANSEGQIFDTTPTDDSVEPDEAEDSSVSEPDSEGEKEIDDEMNESEDQEAIAKALVNSIRNYIHTDNNMNRDDMIEVLTNQHGFKEESLEGMGDTCLERTYESFNEEETSEDEDEEPAVNEDEPEETAEDDTEEEMTVNEDEIVNRVVNEIDTQVDDIVEQKLTENQKSQRKEELIDQILDNSEDYSEEELEETPEGVLENMAEEVATDEKATANFAGNVGARESRKEDHEDFELPTIGGDD